VVSSNTRSGSPASGVLGSGDRFRRLGAGGGGAAAGAEEDAADDDDDDDGDDDDASFVVLRAGVL
jgi:hypothetical protein